MLDEYLMQSRTPLFISAELPLPFSHIRIKQGLIHGMNSVSLATELMIGVHAQEWAFARVHSETQVASGFPLAC